MITMRTLLLVLSYHAAHFIQSAESFVVVNKPQQHTHSFSPHWRSSRHAECETQKLSTTFLHQSSSSTESTSKSTTPIKPKYKRTPQQILPPPPCPKSNPNDNNFRSMRKNIPVPIINWLRDSGTFRWLVDNLTVLSLPTIATEFPSARPDFATLTFSSSSSNVVDKVFKSLVGGGGGGEAREAATTAPECKFSQWNYGNHPMQVTHLLEPNHYNNNNNKDTTTTTTKGVVAFVHGGAWGSGQPWMYRLAAIPFLEMGLAVAIVGYRTYPDADVDGQVMDVEDAVDDLARRRPDLVVQDDRNGSGGGGGITSLVGHSSGAHIGFLALINRSKRQMEAERQGTNSEGVLIRSFVGMSGVYNIENHYEYETGRGVEEMSPLKPACGYSAENFIENSACFRLEQCLLDQSMEECDISEEVELVDHLPQMLFVHGVLDDTVPYTSTRGMVDAIMSIGSGSNVEEKCHEILLEDVGHSDTVMHLMFGGETKEVLDDWFRSSSLLGE